MLPLLKGVVLGFAMAVPVGPIGLLCIRRSLSQGHLAGFICGLGAATADAVFGAVAGFGLSAITDHLLAHRSWLQLGGGCFLVVIGIATLRARPVLMQDRPLGARDLAAAYASTFLLTLSNPMTLLSFIGVFAGLGIASAVGTTWGASLLVLGVFLGSATWFLVLSGLSVWLGHKLERGGLRLVNVVSGAGIFAFGLWQLIDLALGL